MNKQKDMFSNDIEATRLLVQRTNFYFVGGTEQQRNRMYYELPTVLDSAVQGLEPVKLETKTGYCVPYVLTVEEMGRVAGLAHSLGLDIYVSIIGKLYRVQNPKGTAHMYLVGYIKASDSSTQGIIRPTISALGTKFDIL